jgi:hypothetical protein
MPRVLSNFLLVVLMLSPLIAFSTAQRGDILVLKGKKYSIFTNPLRPFLDRNPGRLPESNIISTSNWRGYVATWEVKNDRLVLTDVGMLQSVGKPNEVSPSTEIRSVMAKMFPDQNEVLADWFTGNIIIPDGELVSYVHMGYASTYSKYIILQIKNGVITRNWTSENAEFIKFRDAQFAAFKKTDRYRNAMDKMNNEQKKGEGRNSKQNEDFLREFYSEEYMSTILDETHQ